jgi:hypothetical protein
MPEPLHPALDPGGGAGGVSLITHLVVPRPVAGARTFRDSFGGHPVLPADVDWPACTCSRRMALFFQFDVREGFGLPPRPGSHLSVFMCPAHNSTPSQPGSPLPARYWELSDAARGYEPHGDEEEEFRLWGASRSWRAILHPPGTPERVHAREPNIVHHTRSFRRRRERFLIPPGRKEGDFFCAEKLGLRGGSVLPAEGPFAGIGALVGEDIPATRGFKVGGQPIWRQWPDILRCACGAPMDFVCQVPEDYPFPRDAGAPEQPDSPSDETYVLFLGNAAYLFACRARCSPFAVWVTTQR